VVLRRQRYFPASPVGLSASASSWPRTRDLGHHPEHSSTVEKPDLVLSDCAGIWRVLTHEQIRKKFAHLGAIAKKKRREEPEAEAADLAPETWQDGTFQGLSDRVDSGRHHRGDRRGERRGGLTMAARDGVRLWREASRWDSGYPADGVDHTLSTLIFNRVLNAARCSSPIPMLTA
jgi:hypothetical protein